MKKVKPMQALTRRRLIQLGGLGVVAASTYGILEELVWPPQRAPHVVPNQLPDIQFDIDPFIGPVETIDGVRFQFDPVYTLFLTATLTHMPQLTDQRALYTALEMIEAHYPFTPEGIFVTVAYGMPYFQRFPTDAASQIMPRLLTDHARYAFEEAVPGPTDVAPANPDVKKKTLQIPVAIESNEILITLRSDALSNIDDVVAWLQGSGSLRSQALPAPQLNDLIRFTSQRLMFVQQGLPRQLAEQHHLPYAGRIHPAAPMWMGFADKQVSGSGPASIVTFQGNSSAHFTTARAGDYFANGAVQHLSHVLLDLPQFYADEEPYAERCQYMFRSNPIPAVGNGDQFTDGGGPAFLENTFQGANDYLANADPTRTTNNQPRSGHVSALQRSSRAPDGTPIHIRVDGPGFDALDVPDASIQPKVHFAIFVPTADFFRQMRINGAARDIAHDAQITSEHNGLERFITTTRRQNFLVPPRAHRAFPLLD